MYIKNFLEHNLFKLNTNSIINLNKEVLSNTDQIMKSSIPGSEAVVGADDLLTNHGAGKQQEEIILTAQIILLVYNPSLPLEYPAVHLIDFHIIYNV